MWRVCWGALNGNVGIGKAYLSESRLTFSSSLDRHLASMHTPAMHTPAMHTPAMHTPAMHTPAMRTPAMRTPAMHLTRGLPFLPTMLPC